MSSENIVDLILKEINKSISQNGGYLGNLKIKIPGNKPSEDIRMKIEQLYPEFVVIFSECDNDNFYAEFHEIE